MGKGGCNFPMGKTPTSKGVILEASTNFAVASYSPISNPNKPTWRGQFVSDFGNVKMQVTGLLNSTDFKASTRECQMHWHHAMALALAPLARQWDGFYLSQNLSCSVN